MKFALLDKQLVVATPGETHAVCPLCLSKVIAKCGAIKVHHWAHRKGFSCDPWCEGDNEWRHYWLDFFNDDEQEVVSVGHQEKHFADVLTANGTTVLFRQTAPSIELLKQMENFFSSLVWVVNLGASRRIGKSILNAFKTRTIYRYHHTKPGIKIWATLDDRSMFGIWGRCQYPVIFHFSDFEVPPHCPHFPVERLWCLMPKEQSREARHNAVLLELTDEEVVRFLKNRPFTETVELQKKVSHLNQAIEAELCAREKGIERRKQFYSRLRWR